MDNQEFQVHHDQNFLGRTYRQDFLNLIHFTYFYSLFHFPFVKSNKYFIIFMDILPFTPKDFMNEHYWKQFFKKLKKEGSGNEYFEWYGNYQSFDHLYKKFIK